MENVGTLAICDPQLRQVLEDLGIEYASAATSSLEDAAAAAGFPLHVIIERLGRDPQKKPNEARLLDAPLSRLIALLLTEHTRLRFRLLGETALAFENVVERRVLDHPAFRRAKEEFSALATSLRKHTRREEHVVFPLLEAMEEAWVNGADPPPPIAGGMRRLIIGLIVEHGEMSEKLRHLRECRTALEEIAAAQTSELAAALRALEARLHEYMNLENTVVFPRALALNEALYAAPLAAV